MYTSNGHSDFKDCVKAKMKLLRDFGVTRKSTPEQKKALRKILMKCQNDLQLDIKVRDLITDKITLTKFLKKEGFDL